MVYANGIPSQSDFDNYYESFSKYERESTGPSVIDQYYSHATNCICELTSFNQDIMDLGCGYGGVLRELSKRGYTNLIGVDPSNSNIITLTHNGHIKGICSTIFNLETEAIGNQDCVIIMGVLEHIVDLSGAMKTISSLIADGGSVLVTVPDANQFSPVQNNPYQEFSVEHVNFFSTQSLISLFSQFGMTLEKQWDFQGVITAAFRKSMRLMKCIK
jgi:2-polyprenyl-3-methyl-5-hydroxy-6-metoxy-1,4-benzoquinol methylase